MHDTMPHTNGRSLTDVVAEIRHEVADFTQTRAAMAVSEIRENLRTWKSASTHIALAALLLGTAYILVTVALVALVAAAFWANPLHWFFGFLIVGAAWAILGSIFAMMAVREIRKRSLLPRKTMAVLRSDKAWIQRETSHLA